MFFFQGFVSKPSRENGLWGFGLRGFRDWVLIKVEKGLIRLLESAFPI